MLIGKAGALGKSIFLLYWPKWKATAQIFLRPKRASCLNQPMFSHVVIFWTDPAQTEAADELIAGANKYLKPIPGLKYFYIGKMVGSQRPVVDQTYQVALNTVFADKQAQDDYQVHPLHLEFVAKYVKPLVKKITVYDFE